MRFFQQDKDIFTILSEAISEGILVVNEKKEIVAANTPVENMFGYEKEELVGEHLNKLIPTEYHTSHNKHFRHYFEKSSQRKMAEGRKLFGIKKNGEEFRVEIGLNPFTIYGKLYIMALIMDITNRIDAENKINELNEELEKKIKIRTTELRQSVIQLTKEVKRREEAEKKTKEALQKEIELNELKTNFLSLVSHEFKTPLSSMLTSAVLAGKYTENDQQDKRDKHLEIIKNKIRSLDLILNDFLSVEKMDSGKYEYNFTKFNLSKVFNEVIYDANMLLKTGQRIHYPEHIERYELYQDEKVLIIILSNLLSNAIKFSPENSCIEIDISQISNEGYQINITDKGIGIPMEDQKNIFDRYFRAKNALMVQGTGIGLNMVKDHLKNLGGIIFFKSSPGKGTTFSIEISDYSSKVQTNQNEKDIIDRR